MSKAVKVVLIVLPILALAIAAAVFFIRLQVLDGPNTAYTWTDYELCYYRWVETGTYEGREPAELRFTRDSFTIKAYGNEQTFAYSLPEGTDIYGKPEGEVYLKLSDCTEFQDLIFHEEQVGEELVPVLSATIFEYDGRGEIVIAEFVPEEALKKIPADFRSQTCIERNDREAVPMVKKVGE